MFSYSCLDWKPLYVDKSLATYAWQPNLSLCGKIDAILYACIMVILTSQEKIDHLAFFFISQS